MGHLYFVPLVFGLAGRDSWLSLLVALVPGFVLAFVLAGLGKGAPGRSLVEISCTLFGKPVGKTIGLMYAGYFLLPTAITLRGLMDFMNKAFMPRIPSIVFGLVFLLVCAYAVLLGLESLSRANELLLPLLIITGILASGLTLPDKDYQQLRPVLENGIGPVLRGSVPLLALLGEMVVIGMIQPAIKQSSSLWKNNVWSVLIIGLLFFGPLTGPITIFGAKVAASLVYPTFSQIEYIRIANFFENLQVIAVMLWLFGSLGRISLFYYAVSLSVSQSLGLTDYRKSAVPVGVVILTLSLVFFPNSETVREFLVNSYVYISISFGMIFPAVLLAAVKGGVQYEKL